MPGYRDPDEAPPGGVVRSHGGQPEFIDAAREAFGAMVKRTYGSTEAPTITTSNFDDPPDRARDTDGHCVGDGEVRVVDPSNDRPLPTGQRGEVLVRGAGTVHRVWRGEPDQGGGPAGLVRHG